MTTAARSVGRYEIVRVIGRGGMATVYLARQAELDRAVALKELMVLDRAEPELARRFLREARLAGSLSHPNIVTVYDYLEQDGVPYIAMEYLERGSLRPYVGRLSLAQIGGVLQGTLAGLAHAEEHNVVHRDIKPENVMVTAQGTVKLTDFGIAKATISTATSVNLTTTGTTLGTPRYMAPERAIGQDVGPWSDLYSVGVMVFELIVGRTPFQDTEAPMAILLRQINDPVPPIRSLVPDVDPAISDWVERLLVKDPADRTRAARTAWSELDDILMELLGPRWLRDAELPPQPGPTMTATQLTAAARATTAAAGQDSSSLVTVAPAAPPATVPAAPPAAPRRRRGRRLPWVAGLAGALIAGAAALAGPLGGGHGSGPTARSTAVTVREGRVALTAPAGWHQAAVDPNLPLPLADAVAVTREGARGGAVTAGVMTGETAANTSLLPPVFLQSLGLPAGRIPPRTRVTLGAGGFEALRYRGLRPGGTLPPLTVSVVPTTAGVAAVVCVPHASAAAFARRCASIAGTLTLTDVRAYRVGPSPLYARILDRSLGSLLRRTRAAAPAGAPAPDALRSLGAGYGQAARTLSRLVLSPADRAANRNLVAALDQAARAYAAAAAAAARGDRAAVRARFHRVGTVMDGALAGLRVAGYETGTDHGGAFEVSPGPAPRRGGDAADDGGHIHAPREDSGVGDSRSDDPSDDEPDRGPA